LKNKTSKGEGIELFQEKIRNNSGCGEDKGKSPFQDVYHLIVGKLILTKPTYLDEKAAGF